MTQREKEGIKWIMGFVSGWVQDPKEVKKILKLILKGD
jgi:hypothetical protein